VVTADVCGPSKASTNHDPVLATAMHMCDVLPADPDSDCSDGVLLMNGVGPTREDACMVEASLPDGLLRDTSLQVDTLSVEHDRGYNNSAIRGSNDSTVRNDHSLGGTSKGCVRTWKKHARTKNISCGNGVLRPISLQKRKSAESGPGKTVVSKGKKVRKLEGSSDHVQSTQAEAVEQPRPSL
jgi:hypothetical protein